MKGQKKALRTTHAEDWGGLEVVECWWKELHATFYTCSQQPFQISVYLPDFKVNSCSLCWCVGPAGPGNGWSIWLWFFFAVLWHSGENFELKYVHVSTSLKQLAGKHQKEKPKWRLVVRVIKAWLHTPNINLNYQLPGAFLLCPLHLTGYCKRVTPISEKKIKQ